MIEYVNCYVDTLEETLLGDVLLRYYTYTDSYHMTCIKLGVVCFSTASLSVSVCHNLGL